MTGSSDTFRHLQRPSPNLEDSNRLDFNSPKGLQLALKSDLADRNCTKAMEMLGALRKREPLLPKKDTETPAPRQGLRGPPGHTDLPSLAFLHQL